MSHLANLISETIFPKSKAPPHVQNIIDSIVGQRPASPDLAVGAQVPSVALTSNDTGVVGPWPVAETVPTDYVTPPFPTASRLPTGLAFPQSQSQSQVEPLPAAVGQ